MRSTVTWRSSIASSSADWVLGVARLISSVSRICDITGPGWYSNFRVAWLKMETPVTSLGSISGVNWIRPKVQLTERARERASIVLPTPGTSSMSRCPWLSRPMTTISTVARLPMITFSMLAMMRSASDCTWVIIPSSNGCKGDSL